MGAREYDQCGKGYWNGRISEILLANSDLLSYSALIAEKVRNRIIKYLKISEASIKCCERTHFTSEESEYVLMLVVLYGYLDCGCN